MEKVLDKPFWGYGVGSMKIIADPEVKKYGSWHSDYLQIVMESGFVTLFAYIILSFLLFRNCWRLIKKTEGEQKDVVMGIAASLVCMYFISFFGGHIVEPVLSLVFFSFISIVSIFSIKIIR
jgi:O-antigen ligase